MRIEFECSGGFGGLFATQPLAYRVDTDTLPDSVRTELLEAVESSGILKLAAGEAGTPPGRQRDAMTYSLAIRDGGESRSFAFDDATAPVSVRPLLALLSKLAVEHRKTHGRD